MAKNKEDLEIVEYQRILSYGTEYAVQEWGIKNNLRLFGFTLGLDGPDGNVAFRVKGIFTDPAFKSMELHTFDIKESFKENASFVTVSKTKGLKGIEYPIKFARTYEFDNKNAVPVTPFYNVLVNRGIILPFQSTLKNKDWKALPFEDAKGIKPTEI